MIRALAFSLGVLVAVAGAPAPTAAEPTVTREAFRRPDAAPHPGYNPYSPAKARLGKVLFFDPRLSGSNTISCAHCHNPELGWEDGLARSFGEAGEALARHTPTLLNLAWGRRFGWDGRIATLEGFVLGPIANAHEMNQDLDALVGELRAVAGYRPLFDAAFPGEPPSIDQISLALAAFERTVTDGGGPFDRWVGGDETAIGAAEKAGFRLLVGKAGCVQCHKGWNFSDGEFHDIGVAGADPGRGGLDGADPKLRHAFKTPTLRDISKRAPYMHDGSLDSLEAVVDHYDKKFVRRPTLAAEIRPLSLSAQEKLNLIAFLRILTADEKSLSLPLIPQ
ncbi:MAG: hypothetical protein OXR84_06830 [Magnetovibrio sp.]|nr:hypothetical protein [Magnetovibrio sp.]